jgi:hypothetical protein
MADAINTGNPVDTSLFIVNDYEDIRGGRVNQTTPRGRLAFKDGSNDRFVLPRTLAEAKKAVFVLDWPKPLNPAPYFEGPGLNGAPPYAWSDGSFNSQENSFTIDPDAAYQTPWPVGYVTYDIPPMFLNVPVTSGNKVLVFDGGTFTFGSGAYTGVSSDFNIMSDVYPDYTTGNEGKITVSGAAAGNTVVGHVWDKDVFGQNTITCVLKGRRAL